MKIKTKKQLNLPQLIEWAMKNKIKKRMFLAESAYCVGFDKHGFIYFNSTNSMPLDQLFTVEVEEFVNETTRFEMLAEVTGADTIYGHCNARIVDIVNYQDAEIHAYIDGEFKCIWRDGKLVE